MLLGAQDHPTDGVRDFAECLAVALRARGVETSVTQLAWDEMGWRRAMSALRGLEGTVLLQYTHLAWSRRGFPFGAWHVFRAVQRTGARAGVVLHDPSPFGGARLRDRVRTGVQRAVVRRLARHSSPIFSTLESQVVPVLEGIEPAPEFLPAGSNVPTAPVGLRTDHEFRVAVFTITKRDADEARMVAAIMTRVAERVSSVRLTVFGRGAAEAEAVLRSVLGPVPLTLFGVIDAQEIARILAGSDAMLFVRGAASSRHGTIVAAIAHGLPVVASEGQETGPAIHRAGVVLFRAGDIDDAAEKFVRLAMDPAYADGLRRLQRSAHDEVFSWSRIAQTVEATS